MQKLKEIKDPNWDFKNVNTQYSTHSLHNYPARMIPQIARKLIKNYGKTNSILLDPFMGSGTTILEAKFCNLKEAYGTDINPLAVLIAKVKTTHIDEKILTDAYNEILTNSMQEKDDIECPNFFNIDYWFKPKVKKELSILKKNIDEFCYKDPKIERDVKDFFYVVFSDVVRKVSNTRNGEYKLYRMNETSLKKHNPNVFLEFEKKAKINIKKMKSFNKKRNDCKVHVLNENICSRTSVPSEHIDLVVTSPPYGDSRTTVAYGQFSRLSLQWLGYSREEILSIDKKALGGVPTKELENDLNSQILDDVIDEIARVDEKRAKDVLSFFIDFNKSVMEIDRVLKTGGFCCFVVGNRTVKNCKIPTDKIIADLFCDRRYEHHKTIIRHIPTKRLPRKNSPTNVRGKTGSTMNEEYIIILERE